MRKMLGRRHRTKKEELPKVSFLQLLKLNRPDWLLVLIGVIGSAIIGCLFPLMAILFSEVLNVSELRCAKYTSSHDFPLQIFGSTNRQQIEDGILELVGGFLALAVGASIVYFLAVSCSCLQVDCVLIVV